ncbi:MAG TPA: MAPEG family protein [Acetobacteraceae bacterium]|jgi:hypothetical protein
MRGLSLLLSSCGMAAALLIWRMLLPLVPQDPVASMGVRLGLALAALLPVAAVLAAMILAQMIGRFVSGALDPLIGRETPFLVTNQRIITNTVEQMAVFVPSLLACAAGASASRLPAVLALAGTFASARIVFWGGYLSAPIARAPGMAATALVNLAALVAATWFWLS